MPEKEFVQWVEAGRISASWRTERGTITAFCVMLLVEIGSEWHCAARYDSAHGIPHRDVLGAKNGLLEKEWFFGSSNQEVFEYAIHDLRCRAGEHARFYRAH